jgi:hypothetical protein
MVALGSLCQDVPPKAISPLLLWLAGGIAHQLDEQTLAPQSTSISTRESRWDGFVPIVKYLIAIAVLICLNTESWYCAIFTKNTAIILINNP